MARSTPPSRSELRLSDLKARRPVSNRMMNVKIPLELADAIDKLARTQNVSKAAIVTALLNEGLNAAAARSEGKEIGCVFGARFMQ